MVCTFSWQKTCPLFSRRENIIKTRREKFWPISQPVCVTAPSSGLQWLIYQASFLYTSKCSIVHINNKNQIKTYNFNDQLCLTQRSRHIIRFFHCWLANGPLAAVSPNTSAFERRKGDNLEPMKAAKPVVRKSDPEYIRPGFMMAGGDAELNAQRAECGEILSPPCLFFLLVFCFFLPYFGEFEGPSTLISQCVFAPPRTLNAPAAAESWSLIIFLSPHISSTLSPTSWASNKFELEALT